MWVGFLVSQQAGMLFLQYSETVVYEEMKAKYEKNSILEFSNRIIACKVDEVDGRQEFMEMFLLYTLGVFLCPVVGDKPSWKLFKPLTVAYAASSYNWAAFILDWLKTCIRRYKKSFDSCLRGCVFLLQLAYFDRIHFGEPLAIAPRERVMSKWTDKAIRHWIENEKLAFKEYKRTIKEKNMFW